ncbi:glycerophosphodiester phosphodiesterase family protein [Eubacterium oxidoreducens]|uniref:Ig-like domain (Group 2) n=1 Tax=Eubacterium oxidoreducens TaxID=1732 RepID=A0A1G5ZZM7_EUBOX|nr:glycerophosphodiester phosphodiesterase family protein [Eubacterium oxidoreducens]SDB01617.1 Ig-like domain (group 2) [Eubacterium oxidoreducens]
MKLIKKIEERNKLYFITIILIFLLLILMKPTDTQAASKISLYYGNNVTMNSVGINKKLNWTSQDTSIIKINGNKIKAVGIGKTYLTATKNGKTVKKKIVVKKAKYVLSKNKLTINLKSSKKITGKYYGTMSKKITYQSSNKKVATVTKNGKVKAKKTGTSKIKVTTSDQKTQTVKVKVVNPYPITLTSETKKMFVGKKVTVPLTTASKKYISHFTFSSSNKSVATVSKKGVITAKKRGTTTITIKSDYETKKITLTVYNNIDMSSANFIAHRGYHEYYIENTLAAYIAAVGKGYYGAETDVQSTSDGVFVLSHNTNLKNTYGIDAEISDYTYEELKELTSNESENEQITTLQEYLNLMSKTDMCPFVEIKSTITDEQIGEIVDMVEEYGLKDVTYFTATSWKNAVYLREYDDTINVRYITSSASPDLDALEYYNMGITWKYTVALNHPEIVNEMNERKISISVYSVTSKYKVDDLINCGINVISTDTLF